MNNMHIQTMGLTHFHFRYYLKLLRILRIGFVLLVSDFTSDFNVIFSKTKHYISSLLHLNVDAFYNIPHIILKLLFAEKFVSMHKHSD